MYIVKNIASGKFYMQLPDGKIVELKIGMKIPQGAIVFGDENNSPTASLIIENPSTHSQIVLKGMESQVFDASMFTNEKQEANQNVHEHQNTHQNIVHENQHQNHPTQNNTHQTHNAHNANHPNNWTPTHEAANINPENTATAAGNNTHAGIDLFSVNFEPVQNITLPEINTNTNIALNLNTNVFVNASNILHIPTSELNNEFYGTLQNDSGSVYEAGLPNGTEAGIANTVVEGNLFANDTLNLPTHIAEINGVTPVNNIIIVNTPAGKLEVNALTGDYKFTLLHPLHENGNVATETFTYTAVDANGHSASANLNINIYDDTPKIIGNDINISSSAINNPSLTHMIAESYVNMAQIKSELNPYLQHVTPDLFEAAKAKFIDNLGNITAHLKTVFDTGSINPLYLEIAKKAVEKVSYYLNNLHMENNGDVYYHTANGDINLGNLYNETFDPNALGAIKNKLDSVLSNYDSDPQIHSLHSYIDMFLNENTINHILNGDITFNIKAIGSQGDNGIILDYFGIDVYNQGNLVASKEFDVANSIPNHETFQSNFFDVFGHDGVIFGADGGHIDSIVYNGHTYTYDANNPVQTITTIDGNEMKIDFNTGNVEYTANKPYIFDDTEKLTINVVDNDGDSVTKDVNLHFGLDEAISVLPQNASHIDLGAGNDVLQFNSNPAPGIIPDDVISSLKQSLGIQNNNQNIIDFDKITDVHNVEIISLNNHQTDTVNNLTLNDVLDMTDNRNHLVITGENGDSVNHIDTTGWQKAAEISQNGYTTYEYVHNNEHLKITVEDNINHTGL